MGTVMYGLSGQCLLYNMAYVCLKKRQNTTIGPSTRRQGQGCPEQKCKDCDFTPNTHTIYRTSNHIYYSFNYQYYVEYLLFLIPLVFLFYRIVKIHFRCESTCFKPTPNLYYVQDGDNKEAKACFPQINFFSIFSDR